MKISYLLYSILLPVAGLVSCDNLDLDERLDGPIQTIASKNVLIEDFTGQKCSNCPLAHEEVEKLQKVYGADKVIAVAIHGGPQAVDDSNTSIVGLANEQGREYNRRWGSFSYPKGVVDRQGGLTDFEKWNASVAVRSTIHPKVNLQIDKAEVDASTRQLELECSVEALDAVDGRLQLWLTESDIVALQTMPGVWGGGISKDYVHHHVFRTSINGLDGESLALGKDDKVEKKYIYTISEKWQAKHMSLIMIYYSDDHGVMQVIDIKLNDNN